MWWLRCADEGAPEPSRPESRLALAVLLAAPLVLGTQSEGDDPRGEIARVVHVLPLGDEGQLAAHLAVVATGGDRVQLEVVVTDAAVRVAIHDLAVAGVALAAVEQRTATLTVEDHATPGLRGGDHLNGLADQAPRIVVRALLELVHGLGPYAASENVAAERVQCTKKYQKVNAAIQFFLAPSHDSFSMRIRLCVFLSDISCLPLG